MPPPSYLRTFTIPKIDAGLDHHGFEGSLEGAGKK